ncbi:MAG: cell division protein ZapA [Bacteroidia bacterium]|nr:MAG: cell division protein ZapA [Bacteroidia bacterium]
MDRDGKLSINVKIYDRFYPLKIEIADEEKIRKAAKIINEKVVQYKQRYTSKDIQDFLSMVALQFVTKVIECEEKQDVETIIQKVKEIDQEVAEYIKKEKSTRS